VVASTPVRALAASVVAMLVALVGTDDTAVQRVDGAVVRGPTDARRIALVFTGHEYGEGLPTILDVLARHDAKASFFFTGTFLRHPEFAPLVRRIISDGHYIGPHSDGHLLYCPWTGPKTTLISRDVFTKDVERNLDALASFGIKRAEVRVFLPPYEWYNEEIAVWARALGLTLVNYTPGTRSNADYTEEGTPQFVDSATILDSIVRREREDTHGLNGFILLLHAGAGPHRADKFHARFGELLKALAARGYRFVRIDEMLDARKVREARE
jgi:peptidoglycan/xylan/chitin deacetylase (PgdA/CDA1 family)